MIDLQKIGKFMSDSGLWDKPFRKWTQREIMSLGEAFFDALTGEPKGGWSLPYLNDRGELVFPYNTPLEFRYWRNTKPGYYVGRLYALLTQIGMPMELVKKYIPTGLMDGLPKEAYIRAGKATIVFEEDGDDFTYMVIMSPEKMSQEKRNKLVEMLKTIF